MRCTYFRCELDGSAESILRGSSPHIGILVVLSGGRGVGVGLACVGLDHRLFGRLADGRTARTVLHVFICQGRRGNGSGNFDFGRPEWVRGSCA